MENCEWKLSQTATDLRHEIEERERAEEQRESMHLELLRSQTMAAKGQLVAGVAHEVRKPLFGISATLEAMNTRYGEIEKYGRYLTVLRTEVNRLNNLMVDLLKFGKPTSTEFEIGPLEQ